MYYSLHQSLINSRTTTTRDEVFIEIDFKEAIDYNSDSGLMDINESILFWNYPKEIRNIVKGVSYNVREVQHTFSKGKFTQELDCVINQFSESGNIVDKNVDGRQKNENTTASDTRQATNPNSDPNTNIGTENQGAQESVATNGSTAGANNTNKSLNSGSEAKDDGIIDAKKQPANQGGRDEPVQGRPRGGA